MKNREYNGFASEAQYEAVFNAVKKAVVNFDCLDYFAVYYWDERISVQLGTGLSLVIQNDYTIQEIECDYPFNMFEVDMIKGIYECTDDIWSAFNEAEREYVATIEDCDFGDVDIFFYPSSKQIIANGLSIFGAPSDWSVDDVMTAWECYKRHYGDYGVVGVWYKQIADMENIYESY